MNKYRTTGSVNDLPRQPRGCVTTTQQDRNIVMTHLMSRQRRATDTSRVTLGTHGRPISYATLQRQLGSAGVRCRRLYKGIILTDRHRQDRLRWAHRHVRLNRADWAGVLFTDESRFNLYKTDGRGRVYRRRHERFRDNCIIENDRFGGGSLMIWGGISMNTKTAPAMQLERSQISN